MVQQDFRIRHKVEFPRDVFLSDPARKSFNAAFFLGPIGHFAGDMRELRVPAPHDPTDYYGVRGNSRSLNRFIHWAMDWTFTWLHRWGSQQRSYICGLRSLRRPLVASQNDISIFKHLCPPVPLYLYLFKIPIL
jgi:hypothetical protein